MRSAVSLKAKSLQEELKRRHEQALIEREVNKTAMGYSPSGYSMPSYPGIIQPEF